MTEDNVRDPGPGNDSQISGDGPTEVGALTPGPEEGNAGTRALSEGEKAPFHPRDLEECFQRDPALPDAILRGEPDPEDLAALERWEPEATPGSLVALLPNRWVRRLVLGAIPVLALFFGSALILTSQLGISHALQVYGTAAGQGASSAKELQEGKVEALLVAGQDNAVRVAIWNRRKKIHERHFRASLTLTGGPDKIRVPLLATVAGPGPTLEARFRVPDLTPGRYVLHVKAWSGELHFESRIPAQVVRPPHWRPAVPIEPLEAEDRLPGTDPDPDGIVAEILPGSGERVTNELLERLTIRATIDGTEPVRIQGEVRLVEGQLLDAEKGQRVGSPFVTNSLGLHSLHVVSRHPQLSLALRYRAMSGDEPRSDRPFRERVVRLKRRNAQAVILPERLVVAPEEELAITLLSLSGSGHIFLEVFKDGVRHDSQAVPIHANRGQARVRAPPEPGLFRIQATDDFSNPGTGIVTRALFVTRVPKSAALGELARAVRKELSTAGAPPGGQPQGAEFGLEGNVATIRHIDRLLHQGLLDDPALDSLQAAAYLLSRLDHLHHPTDWLCDTTDADTRALTTRKRGLQSVLVLGLAFTGLLLLALVVPLVYVNMALARRGTQERHALMLEFETTATAEELMAGLTATHDADGSELVTDLRQARERGHRMDRLRHRVQIALITGIILLTVGAIMVLLLRLSWGWG